MELFNQFTLIDTLNGCNDLRMPELRASVAYMAEEQKDDVMFFLKFNMEELAGLHKGHGIQKLHLHINCWTDFLINNLMKIVQSFTPLYSPKVIEAIESGLTILKTANFLEPNRSSCSLPSAFFIPYGSLCVAIDLYMFNRNVNNDTYLMYRVKNS